MRRAPHRSQEARSASDGNTCGNFGGGEVPVEVGPVFPALALGASWRGRRSNDMKPLDEPQSERTEVWQLAATPRWRQAILLKILAEKGLDTAIHRRVEESPQ